MFVLFHNLRFLRTTTFLLVPLNVVVRLQDYFIPYKKKHIKGHFNSFV